MAKIREEGRGKGDVKSVGQADPEYAEAYRKWGRAKDTQGAERFGMGLESKPTVSHAGVGRAIRVNLMSSD